MDTEAVVAIAEAIKYFSAAIAIAATGYGGAKAVGELSSKAMEAIGRNPETAKIILIPMALGIVFSEAFAIYGLAVALIEIFV
jgi:F-type H+-transporting ATPase subunit c